MKFRKQNNDITVDGVRHGFTARDSFSLRTGHTPKTQIWSYEEFEPEPEDRTYWCAVCKSKLEYLKGSDTIWRCCMEWYDTKIQDSPIHDKSDFKLTTYHGLQHYPTADADDHIFSFYLATQFDAIMKRYTIDIRQLVLPSKSRQVLRELGKSE